jgi:hypothetical protein
LHDEGVVSASQQFWNWTEAGFFISAQRPQVGWIGIDDYARMTLRGELLAKIS